MPFKSLGLSDPLIRGVAAAGYSMPTDIQSRTIPSAIAGNDLIGCAQTGTGKTAAFVLPILHRLLGQPRTAGARTPRALVLAPTRELAEQIDTCIRLYAKFMHIRSLAVYGGVSIFGQTQRLRQGVDIVTACPGRLLDHVSRRNIDLRAIEFFVLDEADRMFDMGFINDVRKIVAHLPAKRQTLLFSATMSREVKELAAHIQRSPAFVQVGVQHNPVKSVTHHVYPVARERKIECLMHMLREGKMCSVLVFSRTKHGADKIARRLERNSFAAAAIHSGRSQGQRQRALNGFRAAEYQVLVATDIAARGIDVPGVSHVVNFDVPNYPEDYIHRVGRTGRATAVGDAITFVSHDEAQDFKRIEQFIGSRLERKQYGEFTYHPAESRERRDDRRRSARG